MPSSRLALALVLFFVACTKRVPSPTEALDDALADVADGNASAHHFALAGLHAFVASSDVEKATAFIDQALAKDAAEPFALYGQLLLRERQTQTEKSVAVALDLIERNPQHPLSAIAARFVLDHVAVSSAIDDAVVARAAKLLEHDAAADTAHLVRAALSAISEARGDDVQSRALLEAMGVPTSFSLVGPVSAFHLLGEPSAVEKTGSVADLGSGPFGPLSLRTFTVADGRVALSGEPTSGDGYVLIVDVEVPRSGKYVLRTVTSMDHLALIDGTQVLNRQTWQRPASTLTARAVSLGSGVHRLVVRAQKGNEAGNIQIALQRLDGQPAGLVFRAPAGAAASWSGVKVLDDVDGVWTTASATHEALVDDASDALARLIAARDALGRDRDGARRALASVPNSLDGAAVHWLRAELDLGDQTLSPKVARGRATRELEAALAKDVGFVPARLTTAQLALDDGRSVDALTIVKEARAQQASAAVLMLEARIELTLGLEAQARLTAREVQAAQAGHCEALQLESDVARRRDAVAEADALLARLKHCPNAAWRVAEHFRAKGQLEAVVAAWRAQRDRDESQVGVVAALANALVGLSRFDEALAVLDRAATVWPRWAALQKHAADVLEQQGRAAEALVRRVRALELDPGDIPLRRTVERLTTGREVLDQYAITTAQALAAYEAAPGVEEANAAYLLDAAAIQAFPDGTQVDRVHIIQKALDQAGVQEVAEIQLPPGAVVLQLRTLKPNGMSLEPESIDGKDAVSLPGVEVGDLVEYEYLLTHPSRGPSQPGFTSSSFYFQVARQPNNWSTYTVVAPKGSGLTVDAHNLERVTPVKTVGDLEVFTHEEKRVAPYIPEPVGPPSANEWLPFVSVGAGTRGNEGLVRAIADGLLENGAVTHEVEVFAKSAANGSSGKDAVRAVYRAVMKKLAGLDAGLAMSAAASVGQDRGSRTWLLYSSLVALGFDARLVAVRGFTSDPSAYVFPNEQLLPYLCVRVTLPDGDVWLDPLVRFAPFGELPEFALGGREAFVLPTPNTPLERVKTPPVSERATKVVTLEARVDEEGVLTGTGVELYQGFEAAQLGEALEQLSVDQRQQAIEQALTRMFGGADLQSVTVEMERDIGAPVKVSYAFTASHFARKEGESLVLGALTFPWNVGRRYLAVGQRATPLFIESSEATKASVKLTVPAGFKLKESLPQVKTECPWGRFVRSEVQTGDVIAVEEDARLSQSRVPASEYERFGQFAGEVDLLQARDLVLVR